VKLPDDIAQRALDALTRPLRSHELADAVWPEREDRPLAAKSRAGHAAGRDLIERGWAIQNGDGTYVAASLLDEAFATPAVPPELHVGPDGAVVEVQRRTLGRVAAVPEQPVDGELVVDPATGTVTRVVRHVLGHTQMPAPPQQPTPPQQAGGSLIVENGVVMRVTKQVIGSLPLQPAPAPQQVPPQHAYAQWAASKRSDMVQMMALICAAAFLSPDPTTKWRRLEEARVRMLALALETNAWQRACGLAELPFVAQLFTPILPPAPAWSPTPA
jgi:hypothetical protein